MQPEEAVQVDRRVGPSARRPRDRDAAPGDIVLGVAVGNDHAEAVHRAALEDRDEDLRLARSLLGERSAEQEARRVPEREEGQGSALHERSARAWAQWLSP